MRPGSILAGSALPLAAAKKPIRPHLLGRMGVDCLKWDTGGERKSRSAFSSSPTPRQPFVVGVLRFGRRSPPFRSASLLWRARFRGPETALAGVSSPYFLYLFLLRSPLFPQSGSRVSSCFSYRPQNAKLLDPRNRPRAGFPRSLALPLVLEARELQ